MTDNMKFSQNLRLSGVQKTYWLNQLQEFANSFASLQVKCIEFGKQDARGFPSITVVDHNSCVPRQHHFGSKKELLAFVQGYNMARSKFNAFADFQKQAA